MGDLVGCYGGELLSEDAREARRRNSLLDSSWEAYSLRFNRTHVLDPTSATSGRVDDTRPPFRWEMALVNEPGPGSLPNLVLLKSSDQPHYCLDRFGSLGVPYYAVRRIEPGVELTVCCTLQMFQLRTFALCGSALTTLTPPVRSSALADGASYKRAYATSCSDTELLTRWEGHVKITLQPFLGRVPKSRTQLQLV